MFLCAQEWLTVGLNIPLLFYNTWRYFHSPTDTKELLYDPASVMNGDTLKFCQKEAWCKMSFFVLSFFYYLYWPYTAVLPPFFLQDLLVRTHSFRSDGSHAIL
ncbi:hypothetical protein PO909_010376 [Leuciscus waleckii]